MGKLNSILNCLYVTFFLFICVTVLSFPSFIDKLEVV